MREVAVTKTKKMQEGLQHNTVHNNTFVTHNREQETTFHNYLSIYNNLQKFDPTYSLKQFYVFTGMINIYLVIKENFQK